MLKERVFGWRLIGPGVAAVACVFLVAACTSKPVGFSSSNMKQPGVTKAKGSDAVGAPQKAAGTSGSEDDNNNKVETVIPPQGVITEGVGEIPPVRKFEVQHELKSSFNQNQVWAVTSSGKAYRWELKAGYPVKKWTGMGGGGHRTFVTEIGLIVGETGGRLFRVSDDAATAQKVLDIPGAGGASRVCATSWKTGDAAFVGAAYVDTAGRRRFLRIPIDVTKPMKLDVAAVVYWGDDGRFGTGAWGYSCFTDQSRGYFWSKQAVPVGGVNLATGAALAAAAAPNAGWVSGIASFNLANGGSYAMGGDAKGDVLNSVGYTFAHEPVSDTIVHSNPLTLTSYACASDATKCTATNQKTFSPGVTLGPLSSLNDGRVVGITRGAGSGVYLVSLVVPADLSKGINVEKIGQVDAGEDAYMYTDFTGATLYAATVISAFDLSTVDGWRPGREVKTLTLKWDTEVADNAWLGLKMSARCFKKTDAEAARPAFGDITAAVKPAGTIFAIAAPSCKGLYDQLEIKVEPDGTPGRFSKTKDIVVNVEQ